MRSEPDWYEDWNDGRPARRGRVLAVALGVLLPVCFAGWLVWQAVAGPQDPSAGGFPAPSATSAPDGPAAIPPGSSSTSSPPRPQRTGARDGGKIQSTPRKSDGGKAAPQAKTRDRPLAGKVVVLDPGHNAGNFDHPAQINQLVDAGPLRKECDTTGTSTSSGYKEASFTLDLARRTGAILRAAGATVKFTHDGDRPWGPCIDQRARVGNEAHADATVSIHADGADPGGRGFHIILPATVKAGNADTTAIVGPSRRLGELLKSHYADATSLPPASYLAGGSGLTVRSDLGGLNLSRVPKVFIECGNMRNATDARQLISASWRRRAATGISDGISAFLVNGS